MSRFLSLSSLSVYDTAISTAKGLTATTATGSTLSAEAVTTATLNAQAEKHKTVLNKVKSMTAYDINSHRPNFTIHNMPFAGWEPPDPEMVITPIETEQDLLTGEVMITQIKLSKKIFDIDRYKMQHYPIIHCNLTSAEFDFAEECVKNRSIEDIEARWKQAEQLNVPFLDLLTEKEIIDISLLEYLQGDYK